jgi:hypothetical protein
MSAVDIFARNKNSLKEHCIQGAVLCLSMPQAPSVQPSFTLEPARSESMPSISRQYSRLIKSRCDSRPGRRVRTKYASGCYMYDHQSQAPSTHYTPFDV